MTDDRIQITIKADVRKCSLNLLKINLKVEKKIIKRFILIYKIIKLKISLFFNPQEKIKE